MPVATDIGLRRIAPRRPVSLLATEMRGLTLVTAHADRARRREHRRAVGSQSGVLRACWLSIAAIRDKRLSSLVEIQKAPTVQGKNMGDGSNFLGFRR
jgi:hypothetical protein